MRDDRKCNEVEEREQYNKKAAREVSDIETGAGNK